MTAPAPLGSFPVPDLEGRYRMGHDFAEDPDGDYWWNLQWPDGTYTACGEPAGWESLHYLLPMDQAGGRDGALLGPQSVGPRTLECEALIVSPDTVTLHQHLARLRALLGPEGLPGPRLPVLWEQHDFVTDRRLALITRPSGPLSQRAVPGVTEGGLAAVVSFTLIAASPLWRLESGSPDELDTGLLDTSLVSGRTYDKVYDYTYGVGTGNPGGQDIATNRGDLSADVTFTVTGPVDFPIITNVTTGQQFQINLTLLAGETVTIDGRTGTVDPGSVRLIGRPWTLAPGDNTVRFQSLSGTYYPAANLHLEWRSTSR